MLGPALGKSTADLEWLHAVPHQVWVADDESGQVLFFNRAWAVFSGIPLEATPPNGLERAIHPEDLDIWQSVWVAARRSRTSLEVRLRLGDEFGAWRWFRVSAAPLERGDGRIAWLGTNTDIQAQHLNLEQLRELHHYLSVTERLAAKLSGALSVHAVREALLEDIKGDFRADAAQVSALEDAHSLEVLGAVGYGPRLQAGQRWTASADQAFLTGTPVVVQQPRERVDSSLDLRMLKPAMRTSVQLPLNVNRRVTGVMTLGFKVSLMPDPNWLEWLIGIAHLGAQALERARLFEQTQSMNARLERQVELRTLELTRRTEELESFVYTASHDLKAPLSVLNMASRHLNALATDQPDLARWARRVENASTRMTQMLNALVNSAHSGESFEDPERLELNGVVADVLENLEPQRADLGVTVNVVSALPAVWLPRTAAFQVLLNLLQNALKFAGRKSHTPTVTIRLEEADEHTVLIEDNGVGISSDVLDHVFEPFYAAGSGAGSGMGLAIVRRLLERHGGTVRLEPMEGGGTRVCLRLPVPDGES
jgi:signal transduction histidine kinase